MKPKKPIVRISESQLLSILLQKDTIKGGSFFGVLTDTEEKNIEKPKLNGLVGVRKITGFAGHVYTSHQYMNQRLKVESDYVPSPRAWGVRMTDCPLIEHKGKYYLEVFFDKGSIVATKNFGYYKLDENGTRIDLDKAMVRSFMRPAKEEPVVYRNYALESILEIKINGVRYKIER